MRRDFDFALLIGGLLGFVFACLVIFLPFVGLSDFVYRWQTLITGLVSIVAAAIALWAVRQQIGHAREMEEERRSRQEYAARAMMPHTLSAVCGYANDCCLALRDLLKDDHHVEPPERVHLPIDWKVPVFPELAMSPLQQLIQFGNRDIQRCLSELIQKLQIQKSRMESRGSIDEHRTIAQDWYYLLIKDSLEVYARAGMLFEYARGSASEVPERPERQNLVDAAQSCGFESPRWNVLKTFLKEDWLLP